MPDLFRSVTGRLKDGAQRVKEEVDRRRGHGEETVTTDVDDDPDAEPLPPLETAGAADLAALDHADAPPVEIPVEGRLVDLFRALDPPPPLPLSGPHEVGIAGVLRHLSTYSPDLDSDNQYERVVAILRSRVSITVSPDGLTVRGLLRTRHTPWAKVKALRFTSRYNLLRGGLVEQLAEDMTVVPIPGLQWLLRRVLGGVAKLYENRRFSDEDLEELRTSLGWVLTDIDRRGLDVQLSGPLAALAFLSMGLSAAVESEAEARGITLVREA